MTIYVLRSGELFKIGFSSNLAERVNAIINAVPGSAEFIGSMPGGMDLETHLHGRFEAERFTGEWFVGSPRIQAFIDVCLDPTKPEPASKRPPGYWRKDTAREALSQQMRKASATAWPELNHKQRIAKIADDLGWAERRVRCIYHCERYTLLASEAPALDRWLADWICPEFAEQTQTKQPTSPTGDDDTQQGDDDGQA